jgi:hypothetical protein
MHGEVMIKIRDYKSYKRLFICDILCMNDQNWRDRFSDVGWIQNFQ